MLDDKIIVTGLDPKSNVHAKLQVQLSDLLDEAPSDAFIKFKFMNEAEGAIGILKIYSQQGQFVASGDVVAMMEESTCLALCDELRRQLQSWKSNRFRKVG